MAKAKSVPICIGMPADLAWRVRVRAAMEDKSRSQFVREVLEQRLKDKHEFQPLIEAEQRGDTKQ